MFPMQIENVSKMYKQGTRRITALDHFSLDVREGQFLAVMGASGSGKSTLLHLMSGLTTADGGALRIRGQELSKLTDAALTKFRREHIGLVFQAFNLIPTLSARDNVLLPLRLERRPTPTDLKRVDGLLALLGIGHRGDHKPDALSGGEQQRVAIGRALVNDPAVLLADEPTGNLDSTNAKGVCELLADLGRAHGKTIVVVTHEPSVAAYADEVVVLKDGQLVDRFATENMDANALAVRYQKAIERPPARASAGQH